MRPKTPRGSRPPHRSSARTAWPELRAELVRRDLSLASLCRTARIPYQRLQKRLVGYLDPSEDLIALLASVLEIDAERIRPRGVRIGRSIAEIRAELDRDPELLERTRRALRGKLPIGAGAGTDR